VTDPTTTIYGCANAACGYRLEPTTLPTNYRRCPVCKGPWLADPPPRQRRPGETEKLATTTRKAG
jgi:hypothetical protein